MASASQAAAACTELVELNVGGVAYTTTLSTLSTFPDSLLYRLCSVEKETCLRDREGRIFVDRNPDLFPYVLDFYRYADFVRPGEHFSDWERLLEEAKYFQLPRLAESIAWEKRDKGVPMLDHLQRIAEDMRKAVEPTAGHFVEVIERRPALTVEGKVSALQVVLVGRHFLLRRILHSRHKQLAEYVDNRLLLRSDSDTLHQQVIGSVTLTEQILRDYGFTSMAHFRIDLYSILSEIAEGPIPVISETENRLLWKITNQYLNL